MELQPVQLCQIWVHWEISMFGRWTKLIAPVCVSHVVSGWVRTISSLLDCMHPSSNCVRTTGFFGAYDPTSVFLVFLCCDAPHVSRQQLRKHTCNWKHTETHGNIWNQYRSAYRGQQGCTFATTCMTSITIYSKFRFYLSTGIPHLLLLDHVHMVTWDIYHLESRWRNPQEVA